MSKRYDHYFNCDIEIAKYLLDFQHTEEVSKTLIKPNYDIYMRMCTIHIELPSSTFSYLVWILLIHLINGNAMHTALPIDER